MNQVHNVTWAAIQLNFSRSRPPSVLADRAPAVRKLAVSESKVFSHVSHHYLSFATQFSDRLYQYHLSLRFKMNYHFDDLSLSIPFPLVVLCTLRVIWTDVYRFCALCFIAPFKEWHRRLILTRRISDGSINYSNVTISLLIGQTRLKGGQTEQNGLVKFDLSVLRVKQLKDTIQDTAIARWDFRSSM